MTAAAIYARKSTDDSDRNAEARSTTRQAERAVEYAQARGWTVAPEHVFVDDNVSGAVPLENRPAGRRLVAAAERAEFAALVVSELSRVGRDTVRVPYIIQRIEEAGVEIHGYLSGQRISVDDELGEMTTMLHSLAASFERRRARQRTHDALRRRAEVGAVTGGRVFGYVNHRNGDGYVHRTIELAEASVVRRIFALAANGHGIKRIAAVLNDEAAPAPMPRRAGRPRGWAPSSVREVLRRELYAGTIVWNRTQKVVRRGAKRQRDRTAGEVLRVEAPELQIVDKALWGAAHARLDAARALYFARNGGRGFGRPASGTASPYLMTGLGTCALCGGSMFVHTRSHGAQRVPFWGCMTRHLRGRAVCPNMLEVPLADTDRAVLGAVKHDLLRVEVLETSMWKALSVLQAPAVNDAGGDALRAELAQLDAEVGRLAAAIAAGGDLPALVALLQERERRRAHVRTALAERERQRRAHQASNGHSDALDVMREALTDWQGMLRQETGQARTALTALLKGRLVFTPEEERYTFEGEGTIAPVIAGAVGALAKGVVAPTGFEPVFQP